MITAQSVTRRYGSLVAVDDVSFTLDRGELVGFVGPNGAGKTTLMRMVATYVHPSSGVLSVDGLDVVKRSLEVRRRIGYLAGDPTLYEQMRTDAFLLFVAKARGMRGAKLEERFDWVVGACTLEPVLTRRIKVCSTGYRKRIGLAAALIHDPDVLLLDEPTHGLDPLQVLAFRDLLRSLRSGRVVLFSSHIISEVDNISDRLLIINRGRLLGDGSLDDIRERVGMPGSNLEAVFAHLVREHQAAQGTAKP